MNGSFFPPDSERALADGHESVQALDVPDLTSLIILAQELHIVA